MRKEGLEYLSITRTVTVEVEEGMLGGGAATGAARYSSDDMIANNVWEQTSQGQRIEYTIVIWCHDGGFDGITAGHDIPWSGQQLIPSEPWSIVLHHALSTR